MSALSNKIGKGYIISSAVLSTATVGIILVVLLLGGWKGLLDGGWGLFSMEWSPAHQEFGILPLLFGTLCVTLIALLIAVPLGLLTAIFTSEFLPSKYRNLAKTIPELLAGIPSIIFGLIGIAFFSIWIRDWFALDTGRTIFTAGLLLGVMILPTLITLIDDALQNIPDRYRESAKGLGLYPNEVITTTLLPIARKDMISAVLLALGRAMGETMAVMLVIGGVDRLPNPIFNLFSPGQTITSKLGRSLSEAAFGSPQFNVMILMGLLLVVLALTLTYFAHRLSGMENRLYE